MNLSTVLGVLALSAALAAPAGALGDEDWYQWRGPKRDGVSAETGLLKQWPAAGPALAWKATGIGGGFSSVSTWKDRIYTLGDAADATNLHAISAADGKIVWSSKVGPPVGHRQYPGPRSSPSIDGAVIVVLGQHGDLVCFALADGKEKWRKNLEKEFGGQMMSGWRYSESPLIDGDAVVCTPGGSKGTVLALDKSTGATLWQSAELTDAAAYASLLPVEIGGLKQVLVFTDRSVAGVAAKDGKLLWRADRSGKTAVVPTPIHHEGLVFVTSGYGIGCNAFKVTAAEGKFSAQEVYKGTQMVNHHGGVIRVGEHLYGTDEGSLKCLEFKSGKEVWSNKCVGKGSVAYADGHLVVRSESRASRRPGGGAPPGAKGEIALVEATPAGYKEKGRFSQPDLSGQATWPHPVIVGGKLYIRDQDVLLCYDVKGK